MWSIYTIEYCSAGRKNEIMPFTATWMNPEIIMLSEGSQTEKGKCHYDNTYLQNLKTWYQKKDQRVTQIKFFTKPKWALKHRTEDIERIISGKGMGEG